MKPCCGPNRDSLLKGGTGYDHYGVYSNDIIFDEDGHGSVSFYANNGYFWLYGGHGENGTYSHGSGQYKTTYTLNGTTLTVENQGSTLTIENYSKGDLGIYLHESSDPAGDGTGTGDGTGGTDDGTGTGDGTGGTSDGTGGLEDLAELFGLPPELAELLNDLLDAANALPFIRRMDPLVLDLDGDGIELLSIEQTTHWFDLDGDSFAERVGWLSGDDAFLVRDLNGDGFIGDVTEMFDGVFDTNQDGSEQTDPGTEDPSDDYALAPGLAELATLDENADGVVDTDDPGFSTLLLWRDLDGDGGSNSQELFTLEEMGITSLSLTHTLSDENVGDNTVSATSLFTLSDGTIGTIGDVWFVQNHINSQYITDTPLSEDIFILPTLRGYGMVADLHMVMGVDDELRTMVQGVAELSLDQLWQLRDRTEEILLRWAGADTIDPASRGGLFDAGKLAVLESLLAIDFLQYGTNPNPNAGAVPFLETAWDRLVDSTSTRLMIQGQAREYLNGSDIAHLTDKIHLRVDFPTLADSLVATLPAGLDAGLMHMNGATVVLDSLASTLGITRQQIDAAWQSRLAGTEMESLIGYFHDQPQLGGMTADTLVGNNNSDILLGLEGDDILSGDAGWDLLLGGDGADLLDGGHGYDRLYGGAGDDILGGVYWSSDYRGGTDVGGIFRGNEYTGGTGNDLLRGTQYSDIYPESVTPNANVPLHAVDMAF